MKPIFLSALALCVLATGMFADYRIGAVYSTKGEQSPIDLPSWEGARAAATAINKAGGIQGQMLQLELIPVDSTAGGVRSAMAGALADGKPWNGFVGLSDTDLALEAGLAARKAGKVFITSGATSPRLPAAAGPGFFLACFGDNAQAAVAADWLRTEKKCARVAVIFDRTETYTRLLKRYFVQAFRRAGGKIVSETAFQPGHPVRITPSVLKADAVFLAAETAGDAQVLIRKLRSMGYPGPIVGGDGYDAPAKWRDAAVAKNVHYTTHAFPARSPGSASPRTVEVFEKTLRKQSGKGTAGAFAGLGHDAVLLMATALEQSRGDDTAAAAYLAEYGRLAGVTGPIRFVKGGSRVPVKPVAIVSAESGVRREIVPAVVPRP